MTIAAHPTVTTSPARTPAVEPTPATPALAAPIPVSATLAANEALAPAADRRDGAPARLRRGWSARPPELAASSPARPDGNAYSPVAGTHRLRPAGGLLVTRGLATAPTAVVAGPAASRCCSACCSPSALTSPWPRPSWVSYAAQATHDRCPCRTSCAHVRARAASAIRNGSTGWSRSAPARTAGGRSGPWSSPCPTTRRAGLAGPEAVRNLCAAAEAQRPDHHHRRDLPRPGARPRGAVPQPDGRRAGADGRHNRAQ